MPDASTIGITLKRIRHERGLTQEGLAEKAGLSRDTVSKLEQGRRQGERTTTLMRLANALDVDLGELTGQRERVGGRDGAAVARGWKMYWDGGLTALTAAVPGLIAEARLAQRSVGSRATVPLSRAYQLAACLLNHLGKADLAAVAAERAIAAAYEGDDDLQHAAVQGTYAWALHRQARLSEAERVAASAAVSMEPSFNAPPIRLAVWGGLLLNALAPRVAAGKDPEEYLAPARAASAAIGTRRVEHYEAWFGSHIVHMQSVYAWATLREPGRALEAARGVQLSGLHGISRGRHLLDVAQAHVDARQPQAAEARLADAHAMAPQWFRHQTLAQSLVEEVRQVTTRPTLRIRALAHEVGLD
ncbi:helix-turn-helix domain-containing protein [Actinomadura rubrisoli]|uniref:XRE family transcriptional regulator n=1 Tax=Actinomadura rubrisoli TaxID=2530368 RepID=A0A4R5C1I6_9ACTN|nr:helix-turn-helix transcriptional regulator [Actinomadura rubrisoli]TDD93458.1 XRE family transcriptional regulator [Actinomadura rubrisoli]